MYIHKFYTVLKGGTCRLHQFHTAHRMRQHPLFTCVGENKTSRGESQEAKGELAVNWKKFHIWKFKILGGKSPKEKKLKLAETQSPPKKHMTKVIQQIPTNSCMFFFLGGGGGARWDEYLSCKIPDESPSRSCQSCDGDSRLFCSLDLSDGTEEPSAPRLQAKWSKWWRMVKDGEGVEKKSPSFF